MMDRVDIFHIRCRGPAAVAWRCVPIVVFADMKVTKLTMQCSQFETETLHMRQVNQQLQEDLKAIKLKEEESVANQAELRADLAKARKRRDEYKYKADLLQTANINHMNDVEKHKKKCEKKIIKCAELEKATKAMQSDGRGLRNEMERLRSENDHYRKLAQTERHRSEDLQERFSELQDSHVRAIANVGTGLESITEQEFDIKIRKLHDKVCASRRRILIYHDLEAFVWKSRDILAC